MFPGDVVVFRSVWSSQTKSISIKIIRYITDQRVCLKINASLFGGSAVNTGSLAGASQYLFKKTSRPFVSFQTEFSYLQTDATVE